MQALERSLGLWLLIVTMAVVSQSVVTPELKVKTLLVSKPSTFLVLGSILNRT